MKKIVSLFLCVVVLCALTGCVKIERPKVQQKPDNTTESASSQTDITTDPIYNLTVPHPTKTEEELWQEEYNEAVSYCDECIAKEDYQEAIRYSKQKAGQDSRYETLYVQYAKLFVDKKLSEAEEYAKERKFVEAIGVLQAANETYNCNDFAARIDAYTEFLPKKLHDIHIIEDSYYERIKYLEIAYLDYGTIYDCFGKEYTDGFTFDSDYGYAIFFVDGKYTTLSGIFTPSHQLDSVDYIQCSIWGDGELLYKGSPLERTSVAENINIDITGIKQLKVSYDVYGSHSEDYAGIFDLTVS